MASCITLNKDLEEENGRITFFSKLTKEVLNKKNDIPEGDTSSTINCVYGGAIILFNVNKFRSVKGFDKNCFLYLEEDDLCYRLKKNNHMNMIFPSIKAIHLGSHSSRYQILLGGKTGIGFGQIFILKNITLKIYV